MSRYFCDASRGVRQRTYAIALVTAFHYPYERNLSVTMRFRVRLCFFNSLTSNRLAAFASFTRDAATHPPPITI